MQSSGEAIEGTFEGVLELHPKGYGFLRDVEHRLQLADYRQVHTLPGQAARLAVLARSLGLPGAEALRTRTAAVTGAVRAVFDRLLPPEGPA